MYTHTYKDIPKVQYEHPKISSFPNYETSDFFPNY